MKNNHLHIIAFDVPYPANYGGVIDVFSKIRNLHALGIKISLHCYTYGRKESKLLNKYCENVFYYERTTSKKKLLHKTPFIVLSRNHPDLLPRLLNDDTPILFEGLHTTFLLPHPALRSRTKMVRTHNIEHEYYRFLSLAEKDSFRKSYLYLESLKLKSYEKILTHADLIGAISTADASYFQLNYKNTFLLPPFHDFDQPDLKIGRGKFGLYHGNLQVAENERAAEWLVEKIAPNLKFPLIITGKQVGQSLKKKIDAAAHVTLVENPDADSMKTLIMDAQIHLLPSFQSSGVKLKLLHALFCGKYVVANKNMLNGTLLEEACIVADDADTFTEKANAYFHHVFTAEEIEKRETLLSIHYSNATNAKKIIEMIFPPADVS